MSYLNKHVWRIAMAGTSKCTSDLNNPRKKGIKGVEGEWSEPHFLWSIILSRVHEVERVSNCTYTSGEHHWESNVTFSVAHVSTTVASLVLFYFASFSTYSSQHSSSTVAEAVDTVGRDSRFLQWWVSMAIMCNWARGHTPLVYCLECRAILVIHHMLVMLLSQQCTVWYSPMFLIVAISTISCFSANQWNSDCVVLVWLHGF